MRILSIVSAGIKLNVGLTETYGTDLPRNQSAYTLKVAPDVDSEGVEDKTKRKLNLKWMRGILIGVSPNSTLGKLLSSDVIACKVKMGKAIAESGFKIEQLFLKSSNDSPEQIPSTLFLIYKKKNNDKAFHEIANTVKGFYIKFLEIYNENYRDKKKVLNKEVIKHLDEKYANQLKVLGLEIIEALRKRSLPIEIQGILLDQVFVNNPHENLGVKRANEFYLDEIIESESSSQSTEEEVLEISNEAKNLTEKVSFLLAKPALHFTIEEQFNLSEKMLPLSLTEPAAHHAQLVEKQAHLIDALVTNQQDQVQASNQVYDWPQSDLKEQAKKLILNYQKHLSKNYFFRSKGMDTKNKMDVVNNLLIYLEGNYDIFKKHLNEIDSKKTLSVHRDSLFIQKIGKFFKRHEQTKGEQLIDALMSVTGKDFLLKK